MIHTINRKVKDLIPNEIVFTANNIFSVKTENYYAVYSYSKNWPLFLKVDNIWYHNIDKRSVTTSKHKTVAYPKQLFMHPASIEWLLEKIKSL